MHSPRIGRRKVSEKDKRERNAIIGICLALLIGGIAAIIYGIYTAIIMFPFER